MAVQAVEYSEAGDERANIRPGPVSSEEARKRDELLVRVATEEFLARGFRGATLAAISKRARISKRTIYGMFESKEALFIHAATHNIPKLKSQVVAALESGKDFREVIREVVLITMGTVIDQSSNALLKLAIAERDSFPVLAEAAWEHGFDIAHPLGAYLRQQLEDPTLPRQEPLRLAYHLLNMATAGHGGLLVSPETLFGDRDVWADSVTDLFVTRFSNTRAAGGANLS